MNKTFKHYAIYIRTIAHKSCPYKSFRLRMIDKIYRDKKNYAILIGKSSNLTLNNCNRHALPLTCFVAL